MRRSCFTHNQIIVVLREIDAGSTVKDISRKYGISTKTLYRWKVKFADKRKPAKDRLRSLEVENRRLKSKFAELALDYNTLRAALVNEVKTEC
jgi:putative transposase